VLAEIGTRAALVPLYGLNIQNTGWYIKLCIDSDVPAVGRVAARTALSAEMVAQAAGATSDGFAIPRPRAMPDHFQEKRRCPFERESWRVSTRRYKADPVQTRSIFVRDRAPARR